MNEKDSIGIFTIFYKKLDKRIKKKVNSKIRSFILDNISSSKHMDKSLL